MGPRPKPVAQKPPSAPATETAGPPKVVTKVVKHPKKHRPAPAPAPPQPVAPRGIIELAEAAHHDPSLSNRLEAIRELGTKGAEGGGVLVSLYRREQVPAARHAIIAALSEQQNASALEKLAKTETDLGMKNTLRDAAAAIRAKQSEEYLAHDNGH